MMSRKEKAFLQKPGEPLEVYNARTACLGLCHNSPEYKTAFSAYIRARYAFMPEVRERYSVQLSAKRRDPVLGDEIRAYYRAMRSDPSDKGEAIRKIIRKTNHKITLDVFQYIYKGEGSVRCECLGCNIRSIGLLEIDHVHGGGREEYKRLGGKRRLMKYILALPREEAQSQYRVLCHFCNRARAWTEENKCPHEGGVLRNNIKKTAQTTRKQKIKAIEYLGKCTCHICHEDPVMAQSLWAQEIHHLLPEGRKTELESGVTLGPTFYSLILRTPLEEARTRWKVLCPLAHKAHHWVFVPSIPPRNR
jgi:hypothetical protein